MHRANNLYLCVLTLTSMLLLATNTTAVARGHHGHGYGYGYGYGHGYGYGYRHHYGYGYGYGHGYYGHGYGGYGYGPYYRHGYGYGYSGYGYRHRYGYGYSHNPVYSLLSIPGHVISGLVGYSGNDAGYPATTRRNTVTAPSYSAPTTSTTTTVYGTDAGMGSQGWALLADGHDTSALSYFATAAQSHPRNGIPKVGYALSAAGSGKFSRGVWAMRRAARIDPEGVRYVQLNDATAGRVRYLMEQYHARIEVSHNADDAFMEAALEYLLGDLDGARSSLALARQYGDSSASARSLARLINDPATDRHMGADSGKSG